MPAPLPRSHAPPHDAALSTGSLRLDVALQTGGLLPGEVLLIEGPSGSGKTVLCQHIVAAAQRQGGQCVWLDSDCTLDPTFAIRCGVDPQQLYVAQPPDAEVAMEMLFTLTFSRSVAVIVVDSADSLVAPSELEARLNPHRSTAHHPEEELLSQGLGRIAPYLMRGWTRVVFTRGAIPEYGPSYHQLSARLARMALGLRATARINLREDRPLEAGGLCHGQRVTAQVLRPLGAEARLGFAPQIALDLDAAIHPRRSKSAKIPSGCTHTCLDIMYNQGIIRIGEVFDLAIELGLIIYRNSCFIVGNRELGPDRATALEQLRTLELAAPLEQVIRQKLLRD